jgi:hypothetical protein
MGKQQLCCRIAVLAVWLLLAAVTSSTIPADDVTPGQLAATAGTFAVQAARRMLPDQQATAQPTAVAANKPFPETPSSVTTTDTSATDSSDAYSTSKAASNADTDINTGGSSVNPASSSSSRSAQDSMLRQQTSLAGDLRAYLEAVFRDAPDALLRIGQAWQREEQRGEYKSGCHDDCS